MNCVTPFNVVRSLTGISSIVAGGQSMEALTGCGASAHRTACRADHVCKDSDLYPVIRRNITLDARVSTTTLRGRTLVSPARPPGSRDGGFGALGGFIVLTDDDVDDIVAY